MMTTLLMSQPGKKSVVTVDQLRDTLRKRFDLINVLREIDVRHLFSGYGVILKKVGQDTRVYILRQPIDRHDDHLPILGRFDEQSGMFYLSLDGADVLVAPNVNWARFVHAADLDYQRYAKIVEDRRVIQITNFITFN